MYYPLLLVHGLLRWFILAAGVFAVFIAFSGWKGAKRWDRMARISGLAFVGLLDLQLLVGLGLYSVSPTVRLALDDMQAAMKDHELRFFAVEHAAGMFLALALAHLGSILAKRAIDDGVKYRWALIGYGLALVIILGLVPWWRPLVRLG